MKLVDEDGRDWYSYESESTNDKGEKVVTTKYAYTNAKSQADLNKTGVKGTYMGNIVVTFDGSMHEKLGKGDFINGEGAITAKVTVYGPNGPKDIQHYTGFTMSSDYKTFGAIADGTYDVSYDEIGKSGSLKSHYAVNARNAVPCIDGKNPNPYKGPDGSDVYKYGIFVHGTNRNGWAGYKTTYVTDSHGNKILKPTIVSSGCLLIQGDQYGRFCNQIGNNGFKLVLKRTK